MSVTLLDEKKMGWVKEYLDGLAVTEEDKQSNAQIVETLKNLFVVLRFARQMINKEPSNYQPHSRKGALQEALRPFTKIVLKELHDRHID